MTYSIELIKEGEVRVTIMNPLTSRRVLTIVVGALTARDEARIFWGKQNSINIIDLLNLRALPNKDNRLFTLL